MYELFQVYLTVIESPTGILKQYSEYEFQYKYLSQLSSGRQMSSHKRDKGMVKLNIIQINIIIIIISSILVFLGTAAVNVI